MNYEMAAITSQPRPDINMIDRVDEEECIDIPMEDIANWNSDANSDADTDSIMTGSSDCFDPTEDITMTEEIQDSRVNTDIEMSEDPDLITMMESLSIIIDYSPQIMADHPMDDEINYCASIDEPMHDEMHVDILVHDRLIEMDHS
ncbi:hypothetical protein SBOR_5702 [Sclerotinia borealis F-4128]|uniref:Uncharacterized protein n=1 Tax=Sclerotinia borealis (strain F-4128) TaxID=1432307 RepID=W9CGP5_SCLBF|nr:hypothetical protein SBOR_5702 [Sclerotinia borealis F-4128]